MATSRLSRSRGGALPAPRSPSAPGEGSDRIVVGVDSSFWGLAALDWAAAHARTTGTHLDVCVASTGDPPGDVLDRRITALRRTMPTRTLPVPPDVDAATVLIGRSRRAGLVVLGCRGTGHQGLGVGAAVPAVARSAACDVVVVGGRMDAVRGVYGRISVLLSGPAVPDAIRGAARFAERHGTGLRILWHDRPAGTGPAVRIEEEPSALRDATALAHRLAPGVRIEAGLARGGAQEVIARLTGDDLLVVGVDGRLDAVARAALHHAGSPVLLARPRPVGDARWTDVLGNRVG